MRDLYLPNRRSANHLRSVNQLVLLKRPLQTLIPRIAGRTSHRYQAIAKCGNARWWLWVDR